MIWVLACASAPAPVLPRSPHAAERRLSVLGWRASCDGGTLGDEVSYVCRGTNAAGQSMTLGAVTTGAPLPAPEQGVAALQEDLWVEVVIPGDLAQAAALLAAWTP